MLLSNRMSRVSREVPLGAERGLASLGHAGWSSPSLLSLLFTAPRDPDPLRATRGQCAPKRAQVRRQEGKKPARHMAGVRASCAAKTSTSRVTMRQ